MKRRATPSPSGRILVVIRAIRSASLSWFSHLFSLLVDELSSERSQGKVTGQLVVPESKLTAVNHLLEQSYSGGLGHDVWGAKIRGVILG